MSTIRIEKLFDLSLRSNEQKQTFRSFDEKMTVESWQQAFICMENVDRRFVFSFQWGKVLLLYNRDKDRTQNRRNIDFSHFKRIEFEDDDSLREFFLQILTLKFSLTNVFSSTTIAFLNKKSNERKLFALKSVGKDSISWSRWQFFFSSNTDHRVFQSMNKQFERDRPLSFHILGRMLPVEMIDSSRQFVHLSRASRTVIWLHSRKRISLATVPIDKQSPSSASLTQLKSFSPPKTTRHPLTDNFQMEQIEPMRKTPSHQRSARVIFFHLNTDKKYFN